jgi:uncharacterized protein (DUF1810 family)
MSDPHNLARFVSAQAPVWPRVVAELEQGSKQSHWMWFVFPQIAGLGHSQAAQRYAIASLNEARAFLAHPLLCLRLRRATELVLAVEGKSAHQIFGTPNDLKFRSSMTLFAATAPDEKLFQQALDKYFAGEGDALTRNKLS